MGVVPESLSGADNDSFESCTLPSDIRVMCDSLEELSGNSIELGSPQTESVVEQAYGKNCRFIVDDADTLAASGNARRDEWLADAKKVLHMRYSFDEASRSF